eukprot:jgi/Ulvmu1/12882/UM098_0070.1
MFAGVKVATLQEAHDLLEQILNSRIAPLAFGLALLLTGQMSTFTSTIAGQVVMSGFVGLTSSTLVRRLTTRALAIVPALCVQLLYGAEGTYRMLVIAQVVLAMQLPFTLIPLIKSTSSRAIMGAFASSWIRSLIAWAASFIVFTANLLMLVDMLWMESPEQIAAREEEQGFADKGFDEWLAQVMDVMTRSPKQFLRTCTMAVVAIMAMALLMWMSVHPVRVHGSLRARKVSSSGDLSEDDIETGFQEDQDITPSGQGQTTSDGGPPAVSFVNRLFADLPMQHVRRLWTTLHTKMQARPLQQPLTQALLQQHTLSSHPTASEWELQHSLQTTPKQLPRPLLDWRSQRERQQLWQRACDDMRSFAPSECSLPTLDGMQSLQSLQSTMTVVSEPGGGKGHRMGRGSRKQLAVLVCAIWKQHWDTHGQPIRLSTAESKSRDIEVVQPVILSSARETLVELCDAVAEVLRVPGVGSMLQRGEGHGTYSAAPGTVRAVSDSTDGVKTAQMAQLGPRLAACAAVTRVLHEHAMPLRDAAATAQSDSDMQAIPQTCTENWSPVAQALSEVWPHFRLHQSEPVEADQPDHAAPPARLNIQVQQQDSADTACCEHDKLLSSWGATLGAQCSIQTQQPLDIATQCPGALFPRLCLLGFCLWCLAALLQLASVEPRPELWGRYVAALNHLQGPLFVTLNLAAALQGSAWVPAGRDGPWRAAALSDYGLEGITRSVQDQVLLSLDAMHEELRQLLQQVEAHIDTCGASHDSDKTAIAFAKGKLNIMSLVKRLRSHLARRGADAVAPAGGGRAPGEARGQRGQAWHSHGRAPWRPRQGHFKVAERQNRHADRSLASASSWRSKAHPDDPGRWGQS